MKQLLASILLAVTGLTAFAQRPGATPDAPAFAGQQFSLTWDANPPEENVLHYRLYEVSNGALQLVTEGGVVGVTHTMAGVPLGLHVYYVSAVNVNGESGPSEMLYVKVLGLPTPPKNLQISPQKLAQLDNKLRVTNQHFSLFKNNGPLPTYPTRILQARAILELAMTRKESTWD